MKAIIEAARRFFARHIRFIASVSAAALVALLVLCAVQLSSASAARDSNPSPSAAVSSAPATPAPVKTLPPAPSASPSPTTVPLPCDFMSADFKGRDAAVLERLLAAWGFGYYKTDGKWSAGDVYDLSLFQRWVGLRPSGAFDRSTRQALLSAFRKYGQTGIPRQKLPLEGRYVGINAGHQQKADSGKEPLSPEKGSPKKAKVSSGTQGVSSRVPEYKVNLAVALKLRDALEALGARTLMVRTTNDVRVSNVERCKLMNNAGVDVYLSLHCDGSTNRSKHGLHTLIPAQRGYQSGGVLKKSQQFAKIMQQEAIKATGAKDAGFSTRSDLASFNWSKVPTCLVEMGFMTYTSEDKLLVSAAYQDKLARGFASGLVRYFKEVK